MTRAVLHRVRPYCRNFLARRAGMVLVRKPPTLLRNAGCELTVSLDMVLGHYRQTHPRVQFLQIGAFDGISNDPIYPLVEKHALHGVLVEPQPDAFRALQSNYARFTHSRFAFVNAAIAGKDGSASLYRIRQDAQGPAWLRQIASFNKSVVLKHAATVRGLESLVEETRVPCISFETLLASHGIDRVDLLQIDAEGHDGELIRLFNVAAREPAIVRFEHKHLTPADYEDTLSSLINNRYKVAICGDDTLAYREG
jgi:FkbM family methyltransferase